MQAIEGSHLQQASFTSMQALGLNRSNAHPSEDVAALQGVSTRKMMRDGKVFRIVGKQPMCNCRKLLWAQT